MGAPEVNIRGGVVKKAGKGETVILSKILELCVTQSSLNMDPSLNVDCPQEEVILLGEAALFNFKQHPERATANALIHQSTLPAPGRMNTCVLEKESGQCLTASTAECM